MQALNLPPCSLTLKDDDGTKQVFDIVRRRYVALTPEEWVRQHVIHALHRMGYPLELMQVEGSLTLNGLMKRCDIVVFNSEIKPRLIIECKKPEVPLTQKVLDQICRYNLVHQVPYLYITNGLQHIICKVENEKKCLLQIKTLPPWEDLNQ